MLNSYQDILALSEDPPLWWDQNGVPRFAPFHPTLLGVYPTFAVLYELGCQGCDGRFLVGVEYERIHLKPYSPEREVVTNTAESIATSFRFGDPPHHMCRGGGETMSSVAIVAREVWERVAIENLKWVRHPELENRFDLRPDWARDDGDDYWPGPSRWQLDFEPEGA